MSNIYFPGANTGRGFVSRFNGIIPPPTDTHYTYFLKGGPGVGKNTLMRTVAEKARANGMTVEEFRCASDPKSYDAIRIQELKTVLLDGTAPHSTDPSVPGINGEILDLGYFKNKTEFAEFKSELDTLFAKNKACYRQSYALLGAARLLKNEALAAAYASLDSGRLKAFLSPLIKTAKQGRPRELFAASATPDGIINFENSFCNDKTIYLSGILGEAALREAARLLSESKVTVGYGFIEPDTPLAISADCFSLAAGEGETLIGLCSSPVPEYVPLFIEESEKLSLKATEALRGALETHDRIEELYRPYVDYDKVNEESERLLKEIFK